MAGRGGRESFGEEAVLNGTVEQISFRNEETGYVICSVRPADRQSGEVKVVGTCAAIWVGEEMTARGRWENDARCGLLTDDGRDLCPAEYLEILPAGEDRLTLRPSPV